MRTRAAFFSDQTSDATAKERWNLSPVCGDLSNSGYPLLEMERRKTEDDPTYSHQPFPARVGNQAGGMEIVQRLLV